MSKQRVLLTGATGHTGAPILNGLLDYGKFVCIAHSCFGRVSCERVYENLTFPPRSRSSRQTIFCSETRMEGSRESGVKVAVADIVNDSIDQLAAILKGVDTVISTIDISQLGQAKLDIAADNFATVAKKAGVKIFVPCAWGPIAPVGGVMYLRDAVSPTCPLHALFARPLNKREL